MNWKSISKKTEKRTPRFGEVPGVLSRSVPARPLHLFTVNDDGHGAVIHEFDRHLRPKAARLYLNPELRISAANVSTRGSAVSGVAAPVKLGRRPRRVSARRVNWLTTSAS